MHGPKKTDGNKGGNEMSHITPEAFVLGMSALGAGLAMIAMAGIGIGIEFNRRAVDRRRIARRRRG